MEISVFDKHKFSFNMCINTQLQRLVYKIQKCKFDLFILTCRPASIGNSFLK